MLVRALHGLSKSILGLVGGVEALRHLIDVPKSLLTS